MPFWRIHLGSYTINLGTFLCVLLVWVSTAEHMGAAVASEAEPKLPWPSGASCVSLPGGWSVVFVWVSTRLDKFLEAASVGEHGVRVLGERTIWHCEGHARLAF